MSYPLEPCGVEFGPACNRQICTLEKGHSAVRNGFGHWCEAVATRCVCGHSISEHGIDGRYCYAKPYADKTEFCICVQFRTPVVKQGEVLGVFARPNMEMVNVTPHEVVKHQCRHRHKSFTVSSGWFCSDCKEKL